MKSSALKQEIHGYIEQADDKVLKAIKTLVKPNIDNVKLTKEQKKELDRRKKSHIDGTSKSYSWEQTEKLLKSRKK